MDDARHSFHERWATRAIAPDGVTHTFTIHGLDLNVPIAAAQGQTPAVVSFTLHVDQTGTYRWECMVSRDPESVGTSGFMTSSTGVAWIGIGEAATTPPKIIRSRQGGTIFGGVVRPRKIRDADGPRCGHFKQWNSPQRYCPAGDLGG